MSQIDLKKFINNYGITSSDQLITLAKKFKIDLKFIGLTNNLQNIKITNGSYIINIGDQIGTHWTACFIEGNNCFYYDSFSAAPEDDLLDILNSNSKVTKLIYNSDFQMQQIDEQLCGIYSLIFLYHMTHSKKKLLIDRFKDFTKNYKNFM